MHTLPWTRRTIALLILTVSLVGLAGSGQSIVRTRRAPAALITASPQPAASPFPAILAPTPSPTPSATPVVYQQPTVDAAAFRGQGKLAFVWQGLLYVLDGKTGTLTGLTDSGVAADPVWSPDGQWLAYRWAASAPTNGPVESIRGMALWLVRSDGSRAHEVAGFSTPVVQFVWSPTADVLAAIVTGSGNHGGDLWLVPADGSPHLVSALGIWGNAAVWSPDGTTLAYTYSVSPSTSDPLGQGNIVVTVPANGGTPVQKYSIPNIEVVTLVGWWPDGQGLLFWGSIRSASISADGVSLQTLPLATGEPHELTETLHHVGWLSWSPVGDRLLLVQGIGRILWDGDRSLVVCDVRAANCRALPHPDSTAALDPAWSPGGKEIAYVQASANYAVSNIQDFAAWFATQTLWVAEPDGANPHELSAAGGGVSAPQWSREGRRLLYVRDNGLWLIDAAGQTPVEIVGPFPEPYGLNETDVDDFYGYVSWSERFAWFRRP